MRRGYEVPGTPLQAKAFGLLVFIFGITLLIGAIRKKESR